MSFYILSEDARRDLDGYWKFVAQKSSPYRARIIVDKILDKIDLLAENPGLGRSRNEFRPGLRSHPVGRYAIYYEPMGDTILVVRVLYSGRNIAAIFAGEEDSESDDE